MFIGVDFLCRLEFLYRILNKRLLFIRLFVIGVFVFILTGLYLEYGI